MNSKNPSKSQLSGNLVTSTPTGNSLPAQPVAPTQPIVQQTKVIEYKRGNGCFSGMGCNLAGCLISLLLILCCVGSLLIIVNRPAFIWDRVVSYLNTGINLPQYVSTDSTFIEENIISNIKNGQNDIYITEDQLTAIARERLTQLKDLRFDLESGELSMYWALDNSANPIYANVKLKVQDNKIAISKLGTPNLTLPEFANDSANNLILSILNASGLGSSGNFLDTLFAENGNVKINRIEFQKDKLYLDVFVNVNLFQ